MLCRRCGMESSTTDVCEWCNRPMLPAGAAVSGKAAKDLKQAGEAPAAQPGGATAPPPMLNHVQEADESEAEEGNASAGSEVVLQPLGHSAESSETDSTQNKPPSGATAYGLSDDVTQTSVDISEYVGADQSIFRPIPRDESYGGAASLDRIGSERRSRVQKNAGPDLSENQRLSRCAIAGLAAGVLLALVQFIVTRETVTQLYVLNLGRGGSFFTAIKYGILSGIILGVGLGAILVRLGKGSFIGMVIGIMVGLGFQNPPWGMITGAITGILAGRFATVGLRRVVNV